MLYVNDNPSLYHLIIYTLVDDDYLIKETIHINIRFTSINRFEINILDLVESRPIEDIYSA